MSGAREERPAAYTAAHQHVRRSGRIVRQIAILLFGHDEEGQMFTEQTHTVVLSLHGAGILSAHRFMPEQELILRVKETNREAEVRVVGEIAVDGELHIYGLAFLDEERDFWQMEFPAVSDEPPMVLPLECSFCGQRVEVANGQFEYDISQIHGGLTQHCAECGTLTVWKRAGGKEPILSGRAVRNDKPLEAQGKHKSGILDKERRFAGSELRPKATLDSSRTGDRFLLQGKQGLDAPKAGWRDDFPMKAEIADTMVGGPRAAKSFSGLAQGEGVQAAEPVVSQKVEQEESVAAVTPAPTRDPAIDRRRRTRAKVNFFACVKTAEFEMDVVTCLDMSKGGVAFRSRNPYKQGMKVQIAVPYAPDMKNAPAIFVAGRIANVKEMDGTRRCGVEFLKDCKL